MANNFNFSRSGYAATPPYSFNFGEFIGVYNVLKGTSNNFVAIWADANAGLSSGKFYVASEAAFNVINLPTSAVVDYYTETRAGRGGEFLESDDIVDINIGG
jgi:hypothetical protein